MSGFFSVPHAGDLILPGLPFDYLDTSVLNQENRELLQQKGVIADLLKDPLPLPTTEAREGYYGPRHLEYWLSGYRDAGKVVAATGLDGRVAPKILDFGGASGRVVRHFQSWSPDCERYLCDINPSHVNLVRSIMGRGVTAFRNYSAPSLPFSDAFFDCIVAFSVFTHFDTDDIAWLLELKRLLKPGGYLYLTVHDESTWSILKDIFLADLCFRNAAFKNYYDRNPSLNEKVVHFYNDNIDYSCNSFLTKDYMATYWFGRFEYSDIKPLAHDHQTGVVLRKSSVA